MMPRHGEETILTAIDLMNDLRAKLASLKTQGQTVVAIADLQSYLSSAEQAARSAPGFDLEMAKLHAPLLHASRVELFRALIESSQTALNLLTIMNGGAAVALLAFLGNVLTKQPTTGLKISSVNLAMATFVAGVFLAGAAAVFRYLNALFASTRWLRWAESFFLLLAILAGVASLGAFVLGGFRAYRAFG